MKPLLKILKQKEQERIERHMPAKDAPVLSEEEKSDLEAFQEAWEQHWIDSADTSRQVENDGFHPSSLGITVGKCGRRNVYLLQGVRKEREPNPRLERIFAAGHAFHDILQKSLESMGVEMESEIVVSQDEPVPVKGHADGALVWRDRRILIEVKSCSETVYINRLKWKKPKDEHFEQANIYAHILGYDVIWVIYINKNNQEIAIFEKKADRKKSQKILDRWHAEYLCYKDGKLPVRPYKPASSVCGGCDLKVHCFADSDVGVDLKPYKQRVTKLNKEAA